MDLENAAGGTAELGERWETSAAVLAIVAQELAASVAEELAAGSRTPVSPGP